MILRSVLLGSVLLGFSNSNFGCVVLRTDARSIDPKSIAGAKMDSYCTLLLNCTTKENKPSALAIQFWPTLSVITANRNEAGDPPGSLRWKNS